MGGDLKRTGPQKTRGSGLSSVPQNSAEPLGFCRRACIVENLLKKPLTETQKVLQNFGSEAQLFQILESRLSFLLQNPQGF